MTIAEVAEYNGGIVRHRVSPLTGELHPVIAYGWYLVPAVIWRGVVIRRAHWVRGSLRPSGYGTEAWAAAHGYPWTIDEPGFWLPE